MSHPDACGRPTKKGIPCRNTREGVTKGETDGPYARYRDRPPTAILGIRLRYWDAFRSEYARPELPASR